MTKQLTIDFVSDVSCPWCAVGLNALEQALVNIGDELSAELHFQPFELNPDMPPGGQDIGEHITEKYGSTPEQQASRARRYARAAPRSASTSRWTSARASTTPSMRIACCTGPAWKATVRSAASSTRCSTPISPRAKILARRKRWRAWPARSA